MDESKKYQGGDALYVIILPEQRVLFIMLVNLEKVLTIRCLLLAFPQS
jgi:hypothetical protein